MKKFDDWLDENGYEFEVARANKEWFAILYDSSGHPVEIRDDLGDIDSLREIKKIFIAGLLHNEMHNYKIDIPEDINVEHPENTAKNALKDAFKKMKESSELLVKVLGER